MKIRINLFIIIVCLMTTSVSAQTLSGSVTLDAANNMTLSITVDPAADTIHLTFSGPSGVWYGVGFDDTRMNGAYTIILPGTGASDAEHERTLGNHTAGSILTTSMTNISSIGENE